MPQHLRKRVKSQSGDIVLEYDINGKVLSSNKEAQEIFGYRQEEIIGKKISILIASEKSRTGPGAVLGTIHAATGPDPADGQYHLDDNSRLAGGHVSVSWKSYPIKNDKGKTVATLAIGREVKRKQKIGESLSDLERIIDSIDDGVGIVDKEGKVIFVNERAAKMLGYRPEEAIGNEIVDYVYKEDLKIFFDAVKARERGLTSRYDLRMQHRNGGVVEVSLVGMPRYDLGGNYIGSYTVIKDITERKKNEEMLRASEIKFRSIFETSRDAIFVVDVENSTFAEVNRAACKLYGYTREEFKKMKISAVSAQPEKTLQAVAAEERDIPLRFHKKKDGTVFPVDISGSYFNFGGRRLHTAFIRDISHRRADEDRLFRLNRTLRALGNANKALLRATDEKTLLQNICQIIAHDCGHSMVWIGYARNDELKSIEAVAQVGMGENYLDSIKISWGDNERSKSPMGTSIRTGKMRICEDIQKDPDFALWRKIAARYGYRSAAAFPLCDNKETFGAIGIYSKRINGFSDDEVALLGDLADNLAYGLISLQLREESKKTESMLREMTQYLNNLLSYANTPIIVWSPDFRITHFNAAAERLTGVKAAQAMGRDIDFLYSNAAAEKNKDSLKIGFSGQRWKTVETEICRPDKSVRQVVWNLANIYGPDMTAVVATIALGQDITDRKIAEEQIKNYVNQLSREKKRIEELLARIADEKKMLDGIIESADASIAYLDNRFNFVKVNSAYCREQGLGPKEIIGKNYFSLFTDSDSETKAVLKKLRREGHAIRRLAMPYYNDLYPERGISYRDLVASPIKDAGGTVAGIVLLYLDATQRVRDERSLASHSRRLQEMVNDLKRLQMAVENASDIIFTTDPETVITSINNAVLDNLGYRRQELISQPASILGGAAGYQVHCEIWNEIRKRKKSFSCEVVNMKKNGQKADFELHVSPVTDATGDVISYIAIEHDRTEAKAVERAKKDFISMASHQLRTPLSTISLSAQMILNGAIGNIDDEARQQIAEIFKVTHQMASLIDLFLNASRIEMGRLEIDPQIVEVPSFVRDLVGPLKPLAATKNINLISQISQDIGSLNIDRKIMNMVLENLLTNALKYTPAGGNVSLSVKKEGNEIIFAVSDTGVGVPKKQLHLLFNKMFRASNVGETTGYGLGLSMAKSVVEQSGGRIWAQTKQNVGSVFSVSIPMTGMRRKEINFES